MSSISSSNGSASEPDAGQQDVHLGKQVLVVVLGSKGAKCVLGLWLGATDLVARGLAPERRYLFVIDGAKSLRGDIQSVFGERAEVRGANLHKRRNVAEYPYWRPTRDQGGPVSHGGFPAIHSSRRLRPDRQARCPPLVRSELGSPCSYQSVLAYKKLEGGVNALERTINSAHGLRKSRRRCRANCRQ